MEAITIPVAPASLTDGVTYSYTVDWGGSEADDITVYSGDATHTYATPGTYTVTVTGVFPAIYFNGTCPDSFKGITSWDTNVWRSMNSAFRGCDHLAEIIPASEVPITVYGGGYEFYVSGGYFI